MGIVLFAAGHDTDHFQHLIHTGLQLGAGMPLVVHQERLKDLVAHRQHGVQRCHGILKDHRDLLAANGLQLPVAEISGRGHLHRRRLQRLALRSLRQMGSDVVLFRDSCAVLITDSQNVLFVKPDRAVVCAGRALWQQPHDGQCRRCLAGACLAHQSQGLSLIQGQGYTVNGMDRFQIGFIIDLQVTDLQQYFTHFPFLLNPSASGQERRASRRRPN